MPHSDKVDMLFIYWKCQKNSRLAAQTYAQRYPDREHPVHSVFYNLERNLRTYGSFSKRVNNLQQRRGDALGEEVEGNLLAYVRANPRSSTRHVGRELGISHTTVCKILKKYKMHPYRPDLVQHLRQGDAPRRLAFVAWLMTSLDENPLILNSILWTDESKFTNNGVINKQNNRYWDDQNPHWTFETNNQTVWGTNVWCGLIGGKLLGPFFYDGTLNGRRYYNFLLNELPMMLDDIPLALRGNIIFQHDGAPAHNAHIVRDYLNAQFQNRWLGTYGPIEWPPRSPDLTPLDFFLWGHLKTIVYADPPINLQHLKDKITAACNQLTDEQITAATNKEFMRRAESCFVHGGEQFEQFIR
eukprot:XP_003240351.1 PREDICTED: uncharacterized protein LOC100573963 [Acyrthosiphon pisum]